MKYVNGSSCPPVAQQYTVYLLGQLTRSFSYEVEEVKSNVQCTCHSAQMAHTLV